MINFLLKSFNSFFLISVFSTGIYNTAICQVPKQQPRCTASATQIYFVEDGQMRMDVYPSAPRGYQLNILGTGVDNFEVVLESHFSTVSVIPSYTNATSAKWQINFAPNKEQVLCSINLKNKCTGQTLTLPLTVGVRLFNQ